jgi:hypothetical protein
VKGREKHIIKGKERGKNIVEGKRKVKKTS